MVVHGYGGVNLEIAKDIAWSTVSPRRSHHVRRRHPASFGVAPIAVLTRLCRVSDRHCRSARIQYLTIPATGLATAR